MSLLTLLGGGAGAQEPSKLALTKAAFVLNFSKYTEWPAHAFVATDSPIQLCILQLDSDIGRAMLKIDGKVVRERPVRVRPVDKDGDLSGCHILFVEQDTGKRLGNRLLESADSPMLTVGDAAGFASRGGMIELVPSANRLGFAVNLEAAERAELRLSSQLLALARIVKDS